jgi:DNA-damage-inducible protein D
MTDIGTTALAPSTPTEQRVPTAPESPFDAIRRVRPDGSEYWSARELMPLLGYRKWDRFAPTVEQARNIIEAENGADAADQEASHHREAFGRTRQIGDNFHLSRRSCYLTAMRGDSRKEEIRAALLYFAAKTREAELAQGAAAPAVPKTGAEVVLEMAQQLVAQGQRLVAVEASQAATAAKLAAIEGRHDEFTALGYAKLNDHPTSRPYLAQVGKRATAIMREQGQLPHQRQDATFGAVNVYPVSVLERAFTEVSR